MTVERILKNYDLFDSAILGHGFVRHLRDYEIRAEIVHAREGRGVYRYLFTHCVLARVETALPDDTWAESWSDLNLDAEAWERDESGTGYLWGVCWAAAYPGWRLILDSDLAALWSRRLGRQMYEILVESNVFRLTLIFHSVVVEKRGEGTPILDAVNIPIVSR